jgi:hypothetical protein
MRLDPVLRKALILLGISIPFMLGCQAVNDRLCKERNIEQEKVFEDTIALANPKTSEGMDELTRYIAYLESANLKCASDSELTSKLQFYRSLKVHYQKLHTASGRN